MRSSVKLMSMNEVVWGREGLRTLPKDTLLQKQYVGSLISTTTSFFILLFSFFAACCVRFGLPFATGFGLGFAAGFSITLTTVASSFPITGERFVETAERGGG